MKKKLQLLIIFAIFASALGFLEECRLQKHNEKGHKDLVLGSSSSTSAWLLANKNDTKIYVKTYFPDKDRAGRILSDSQKNVYWHTVTPGWNKMSLYQVNRDTPAKLTIDQNNLILVHERISHARIMNIGEIFWLTCEPSKFKNLLSQLPPGYDNLLSFNDENSSTPLDVADIEPENPMPSMSTTSIVLIAIVIVMALVLIAVSVYSLIVIKRKTSTDSVTECLRTGETEEHIYDEPQNIFPHNSSRQAFPFHINSFQNPHQYHHDYPGLHQVHHQPESPQHTTLNRSISDHNSENSFYMRQEDIQQGHQHNSQTLRPNSPHVSENSLYAAINSS